MSLGRLVMKQWTCFTSCSLFAKTFEIRSNLLSSSYYSSESCSPSDGHDSITTFKLKFLVVQSLICHPKCVRKLIQNVRNKDFIFSSCLLLLLILNSDDSDRFDSHSGLITCRLYVLKYAGSYNVDIAPSANAQVFPFTWRKRSLAAST